MNLVNAAENLSNKIFCLGFAHEENSPGPARSSFHSRRYGQPGPAYAKLGQPGHLGTLSFPRQAFSQWKTLTL